MAELKTRQAEEAAVSAQAAYQDEYYDLLPIELKLIKYSLGLGIGLLIVFIVIFKVL